MLRILPEQMIPGIPENYPDAKPLGRGSQGEQLMDMGQIHLLRQRLGAFMKWCMETGPLAPSIGCLQSLIAKVKIHLTDIEAPPKKLCVENAIKRT